MATYNANTLQDLLDKRNYIGAADYLSTQRAASPQKQIILNRRINQLRRDGAIQAAMLQGMTPDEQKAFHFISAIDGNGRIPHSTYDNKGNVKAETINIFGDNYVNAVNDISTKNGTMLSRVGISISDDTLLNEIYNSLGVQNSTQAFDKFRIRVEPNSDNGGYNLSVDKTNVRLSKLFSAANQAMANRINASQRINRVTGEIETSPLAGSFEYFGVDASGTRYNESDINMSSIRKAGSVYGEAKRIYDSALERLSRKTYDEEMYVTPFLGQGHANAYKAMRQGMISMDDYKKIVEERTNVYNTLLKQADLTQQQEVYVTDMKDDESSVFKKVDSVEARRLNQVLLVAMDKNRVTYSAAMHGGQVGTYITITPGEKTDKIDVEGLDHGYRIFVPGLFKSSCDEAFENDTQTLAARDLADMKHWNYGKNLSDGTYIGWDDNIGTYTLAKDQKGNQIKVPIEQETALRELNRENIVQKSVEVLTSNIDENGNPIQQIIDGTVQPFDIEQSAKTLAAVGVNEIYPKGQFSDGQRLEAHNDMYNVIMELLNSVINKQNDE